MKGVAEQHDQAQYMHIIHSTYNFKTDLLNETGVDSSWFPQSIIFLRTHAMLQLVMLIEHYGLKSKKFKLPMYFKGQHSTKFHVWNKTIYITKMSDLFQSAFHLASFQHNQIIFTLWFLSFIILPIFFSTSTHLPLQLDYKIFKGRHVTFVIYLYPTTGLWELCPAVIWYGTWEIKHQYQIPLLITARIMRWAVSDSWNPLMSSTAAHSYTTEQKLRH